MRVIDADAAPPRQSRALAVNPRTLAILRPSGATDRLIAAGHEVSGLDVWRGSRRLFSLDIAEFDRATPFMLVLPQGDVETLLIEVLRELGTEIERPVRLTALTHQGERLEAVVDGQVVSPDVLIGADGAHSTVRKALDIPFEGDAYETRWSLADVRIATKLSRHRLALFETQETVVGVTPIRGDLVRLVSTDEDVLARVPGAAAVREVVWSTTFVISHRLAAAFQRGGAFLVGDAAHIHSPLGGRGMNLGIEDAAWLAWLLSRSEESRYTADRRPIARKVLATVDPATRFAASKTRGARFVRNSLLPLAARLPAVRRAALRRVTAADTPEPPWLGGPLHPPASRVNGIRP